MMRFLIAISITFALSFYLIRDGISYIEIREIPSSSYQFNVSNDNNLTDFDRIKESLNETKDLLSFSLDSKHNIRPDILLETRSAHCVGYAAYFNSKLNSYSSDLKSRHIRAKILIFGIDVHQLFNNQWIQIRSLADHDICIVVNSKTGETYFVDPSLSEILGNLIIKQDLNRSLF
jgi:hypothetical protein